MSFLVEIFLPLYKGKGDGSGQRVGKEILDSVRTELTEKYGGVTAYLRSPASGEWKDEQAHVVHDDLVIFEVMTDSLEKDWWTKFKRRLESIFQQKEILIRATTVEVVE